jgi:hypothetical protein
MKIKLTLSTRVPLYGATALLVHCASAQTWQTVDDFQYLAQTNGQGSQANALTVDPFGNVFVAGCGRDANGVAHALIRKSSDAGGTWALVDDFSTAPGSAFYGGGSGYLSGGGIDSDSAGVIYAAGRYSTGNGYTWFAAQGSSAGTSWNNVDTAGPVTMAVDVAADSAGNAFVVGRTNGVANGPWLVRKGANGGTSWATADLPFPADNGSHATAVFCHPTRGVFVTGGHYVGSTFAWTTRRSLDGGFTWTTVDSSVPGVGFGIGADAVGNIYVVGNSQASNPSHWLTRKSSDGGNSWTTVDDYYLCVTVTNSIKPLRTSTTCHSAAATGFAADANGNLFVCGYLDAGSPSTWIVRENPGGNTSWRTVDTFQYAERASAAYRIAADTAGNVYVAGTGIDANGVGHWIVRRN